MKLLGDYIKSRRGVLLFFALAAALLGVSFALFHLPLRAVAYPFALALLLGLAALALDFRRVYKLHRELSQLETTAAELIGVLPGAESVPEADYQAIVQSLCRQSADAAAKAAADRADMLEYYTLWGHQIKTPIAAMELLLQEEPADARALKRELLKTSQYVEMALSYQRMEGEGNDLVIQRYELRPVVMQAVKKVSPLLIHKHISFSAGDLSGEVLTDEKWLVFVLEQLLTNASKYTKEGGSVRIGKENGLLVLRDTGIGIRPEDLPRIFEWGYTGYNGRLDKRSTGVGLALVKQVMEMLGNKIEIRSVLGEGTEVFLDLRRTELEAE